MILHGRYFISHVLVFSGTESDWVVAMCVLVFISISECADSSCDRSTDELYNFLLAWPLQLV